MLNYSPVREAEPHVLIPVSAGHRHGGLCQRDRAWQGRGGEAPAQLSLEEREGILDFVALLPQACVAKEPKVKPRATAP